MLNDYNAIYQVQYHRPNGPITYMSIFNSLELAQAEIDFNNASRVYLNRRGIDGFDPEFLKIVPVELHSVSMESTYARMLNVMKNTPIRS